MYSVKPVLNRFENIELPNCMYNMKNLQLSGSGSISGDCGSTASDTEDFLAKLSKQDEHGAMEVLEQRQDIILEKLKELKEQILSMKHSMRMCGKPAQGSNKATTTIPTGRCKPKVSVRDVVINVHPENLPFSFQLLQKLWRQNLHLVFSFHLHSSVSAIGQEATLFQTALVKESETKDTDVVFRCIWKNGNKNAEMILSPIDHVPIYSEVNILRFLSRIGPDFYNYETKPDANESDKVFDICFKLTNIEHDGERQKLMDHLMGYLKEALAKAQLTEVSLVDLAVYSSLMANRKSIPKNVQPKVINWLKMVEGYCNK